MTVDFLKRLGLAIVCAFFLLSLCWSDSLTLRDGRHLEGKYVGGSSDVVGFVTNGAVQYYPITDVLAVVFGNPGVDSPIGGIQQNSLRNRPTRASRRPRVSAALVATKPNQPPVALLQRTRASASGELIKVSGAP
jgi:hypothetical protein